MSGSDDADAPISPEEQAKQGTEESFATAKLRADVARQQMRLAKDQLKRARKRFKDARREARQARKLADVARRSWKKAKRRSRNGSGDTAAVRRDRSDRRSRNGSAKKSAGHQAGGKRGSNGKKPEAVRRGGKDRKAGSASRRRR